MKAGTSAVLLQSGLDESWWADSLECYTYLRNIQDLLYDGLGIRRGCFSSIVSNSVVNGIKSGCVARELAEKGGGTTTFNTRC